MIAEKLISGSKPSIKATSLLDTVIELSDNEEFAVALCTQLISLDNFRREKKVDAEEVIDSLYGGLEATKLDADVKERLGEIRETLLSLLKSEWIRLPAKALKLSTDFEKLLVSGNVVTDVRPIFDEDRATIVGSIVSQTLKIQYVDRANMQKDVTLHLALDLDDVSNLISELEKAKQKAECAKEHFGDKDKSDIFVTGEEIDVYR